MAIETFRRRVGSFVVSCSKGSTATSISLRRTHIRYSPNLRGKEVQIVLVRLNQAIGIDKSLLFKVTLSTDDIDLEHLTWIGYERDNAGKILPKIVDMAASMDPEK